MKMALLSMLLIFSTVACTTLEPVDAPAGDRVRLVTADEAVHTFRVTEINLEQDMVLGRNVEVPIKEVVALETQEVSVRRTTLLTGGVGIGVAVLIAVAIAPAVILGGG